jgi:hypothetical protein
VILIIGLVLIGSVVVLLLGNLAIDDLQQSVDIQEAEYSMREVDSRLSEISTSPNDAHTLQFSDEDDVVVRNQSYMNITANRDSGCRATIPMGSIIQSPSSSERIAYEGGGVWRKSGGGSVMLSPPDLQYRNGTINFPIVSVGGSVTGQTGELKATKNQTASRQRTQQIRQVFSKASCWPPSNITIDVHSEYYDAWARYLEAEIGGSAKRFPGNESARIRITKIASVNATKSGNAVSSSKDFVATVKITGLAATAGGGGTIDPDIINARVLVNETGASERVLTPWPDGDKNDDIQRWEDDLNHPEELSGDFAGGFSYKTKVLPPNSTVTLEVRAPKPDGWNDTSPETTVSRFGTPYNYRQPDSNAGLRASAENNGKRFWVDTSDPDEENIVILGDGESVPTAGEAAGHQPSLSQMLGPRLASGTTTLQMQSNEKAVLFELTNEDAKIANAPGPGNPDYNDAVAIIRIEPVGGATLGYGAEFSLKVSYNRVKIVEN